MGEAVGLEIAKAQLWGVGTRRDVAKAIEGLKRVHGSRTVAEEDRIEARLLLAYLFLDGSLVRETQKLNNLMVLLTIAISGGPFLGLLGTVVGVMITFAAIAATGDVNVAAIAPGIVSGRTSRRVIPCLA